MSLISTPGAADANSYADVTFADDYFDTRLGSSAWKVGNSDENKEASLIQATRILDADYDWVGYRHDDVQALGWPRSFAPNPDTRWITLDGQYIDNTIIPIQVKQATCELAISIVTSIGYTGDVNDLRNIQVGPIKLGINTLTSTYAIPKTVMELLRRWGKYQGGSGGSTIKTVKVIRA